MLVLNKLERLLTVCKVKNIDDIDLSKEFYFIGKTDEEISLVCETNDVPENTIEREDGWRGFRIQGILDFSLIGILSKLSGILADNKIGICITKISTFLILCDLAVCLATLYVSFSLVFALMRYLQGKVFLIRFYSPTTLSSSRAEFRLPSRLACA